MDIVRLLRTIAFLVVVAGTAHGQSPTALAVGPGHTLDHDFALVRSARALDDGRLLVVDWLEQAVYVVDFDLGTKVQIGRAGQGPGEYRLPTRLLSMAGDSTLLIDLGNHRFNVIGPDLRFHRTIAADAHGANYGMDPVAIDRGGRLYFAIPGWAAGPSATPNDSVTVVRYDPARDQIEELGRLLTSKRPDNRGPAMRPRLPFEIFSPRDAWVVTLEGTSAIIRSGDYHVEWMSESGALRRGTPVSTVPIRVTDEMRHQYIRRSRETGVMSGRGPDGGLGAIPKEMLTPQAIAQGVADNTFAEYLPAFDASSVFLSPTGTIWVGQYSTSGTVSTYDVFDGDGERLHTVTLPDGRRLVAVGRDAVYAVWSDEFDLQHLEHIPNPIR